MNDTKAKQYPDADVENVFVVCQEMKPAKTVLWAKA